MPRRVRTSEPIDLVRRLLPTVVFVVGIFGPLEAVSAASVAALTSREVDDHSQYCKCRHCSKDSCCCGSRKAKPKDSGPFGVSAHESPSTVSGPCLSSAPCGEPGLPNASSSFASGEAASLSRRLHVPRVRLAASMSRRKPRPSPDSRLSLPTHKKPRAHGLFLRPGAG